MSKTIAIAKSWAAGMLTALFIAANIGLPHLFHLIPGGGIMFLPIYFFTAFAAVSYGRWLGILTGVMSPLLGFVIFDAPKAFMIPDMILKGVLLSSALPLFLAKAKASSSLPSFISKAKAQSRMLWGVPVAQIIAIPMAIVAAWMAVGILESLIGRCETAFQDFFTGIPGLLMMTLSGWLALFFNRRIAS